MNELIWEQTMKPCVIEYPYFSDVMAAIITLHKNGQVYRWKCSKRNGVWTATSIGQCEVVA